MADTFEHEGVIYNAHDFKGPEQSGPIVGIYGDTKPCDNEYHIAHQADAIVHEATYIEGEKTMANNYHHSHIDDVFNLAERSHVKHTYITHLSNRYNKEDIAQIEAAIRAQPDSHPSFSFVKDFDSFTI